MVEMRSYEIVVDRIFVQSLSYDLDGSIAQITNSGNRRIIRELIGLIWMGIQIHDGSDIRIDRHLPRLVHTGAAVSWRDIGDSSDRCSIYAARNDPVPDRIAPRVHRSVVIILNSETLITAEEERLVLDDWAAERAAELVAREIALALVVAVVCPGVGVQSRVAR